MLNLRRLRRAFEAPLSDLVSEAATSVLFIGPKDRERKYREAPRDESVRVNGQLVRNRLGGRGTDDVYSTGITRGARGGE
jgi:hypothetical protein